MANRQINHLMTTFMMIIFSLRNVLTSLDDGIFIFFIFLFFM